jgi:hypothetical protein
MGGEYFFYSNEGNEPIHIHAEKGEMECKYWLNTELVDIKEEFTFNFTPAARKEIRKIIFQHFDLIVLKWENYFK